MGIHAPAGFLGLTCGFGNLYCALVGLAAKWASEAVDYSSFHVKRIDAQPSVFFPFTVAGLN
jgi:hypothetical protein